jgi:hypothetical protein
VAIAAIHGTHEYHSCYPCHSCHSCHIHVHQVARLEATLRVASVEKQQLQQRLEQQTEDLESVRQESGREADGLRVQLAAKDVLHRSVTRNALYQEQQTCARGLRCLCMMPPVFTPHIRLSATPHYRPQRSIVPHPITAMPHPLSTPPHVTTLPPQP